MKTSRGCGIVTVTSRTYLPELIICLSNDFMKIQIIIITLLDNLRLRLQRESSGLWRD